MVNLRALVAVTLLCGCTVVTDGEFDFNPNCAGEEFGNCDGDLSNGCEASLRVVESCGACGNVCNGTFCSDTGEDGFGCTATCEDTVCGEECADLNVREDHCGSCGFVCGRANTVMSVCEMGDCKLSCMDGFDNCNDDTADGCETDLDSTLTSCGSCEIDCTEMGAEFVCEEGECAISACELGLATCGEGAVCGTNLLEDAMNCGSCGNVCDGECVDGVCDPVISIKPGRDHTCLLRTSGRVLCVGSNFFLQSGQARSEAAQRPNAITSGGGPLRAIEVSAGNQFSCAIDVEGKLLCWGRNEKSQGGREGGSSLAALPVLAEPGHETDFAARTFTGLSTRFEHSCAIDDQSDVWCWGGGESLGVGANTLAQKFELPRDVTSVVAGQRVTAAILDDGSLYLWGRNTDGQLGFDPSERDDIPTPTLLPTEEPVLQLAFGAQHTCYLDSLNVVRCMGLNSTGQLGSATPLQTHQPQVVALTGVPSKLVGGLRASCVLGQNGTVICWGRSRDGETGQGMFRNSVGPSPVTFPTSDPLVSLTGNVLSFCAVTERGFPFCWGVNTHENLNLEAGEPTAVLSPTVGGLPLDLMQVSLGRNHGCGIRSDGTELYCWGRSIYTLQSSPETQGSTAHEPGLTTRPTGVSRYISVAVGEQHTCFITANNRLFCAGDNRNGQLGISASGNFLEPQEVLGLPTDFVPVKVSAGRTQTCVVGQVQGGVGGEVHCFGEDFTPVGGSDIDNSLGGSDLSTPIPGLDDVADISLGFRMGCAIRTSGEVRCWGADDEGQRGDGDNNDGIVILPMSGIGNRIDVGETTVCARIDYDDIVDQDEAWCWGSGEGGILGDDRSQNSDVPVRVSTNNGALVDVAEIAVSESAACAVLDDGTVQCWGDSSFGEFGQVTTDVTRAVLHPEISGATQVWSGGFGSRTFCFLQSDPTRPVACVGSRVFGVTGGLEPPPRVASPRLFQDLNLVP